jgi:hypothetical protein
MAEIRANVAERNGADWAGAAGIFGEEGGKLTYNVSPEAILEVALSRSRQKIIESSRGS